MRYFLICDDSGTPVYCDHPDGMMMGLIFNGLDKFLTEKDEHFSQAFKSMSCGGVLFVARKYKNLSFLVVSDQGESEMYLRNLLQHMYLPNPTSFEHMVMLFGRQVMLEGRYTSFTRHKKTIQHIIDTTCALGDRHQAMLVRATERLEVNDRTRGECFNALKNTVQNDKLITHALVFVGTKLLVSYTRGGKAQDIDPSDLLLLITDFHATFHPPDREVKEMELPVADYRDHSNITIRGAQRDQSAEDIEEPSIPLGGADTAVANASGGNLASSEPSDTRHENDVPKSELNSSNPFGTDELNTITNRSVDDHNFPSTGDDFSHQDDIKHIGSKDTEGFTASSLLLSPRIGTKSTMAPSPVADMGQHLSEQREQEHNESDEETEVPRDYGLGIGEDSPSSQLCEAENFKTNFDHETDKVEHSYTEDSPDPPDNGHQEQQGHELEEEEEEEFQLRKEDGYDPSKLTKYKALHLRTPRYAPYWVYYAELGHKTTLVLLTSNNPQNGAKGTPEERSELDVVRDSMRSLLQTYSTYLITKEHTHLPILSFLHQFPGLVHFIFVDRTFNRVIAPSISALHTMDPATNNEEEERTVKRVIKRHVWNMCYQGQQYLSEGVQSIVRKDGPWQFSYRLWVEDVDGFELIFPPEVQFSMPQGPQTNRFYQKLIHRFFPTRGNLRCYELFTLYLSTLSAEAVAHHDRDLVALLLNRAVK